VSDATVRLPPEPTLEALVAALAATCTTVPCRRRALARHEIITVLLVL
jgi:hypothetical protein